MNSISTKELLREICKYARENGVKLNQTQAKIVLKASLISFFSSFEYFII